MTKTAQDIKKAYELIANRGEWVRMIRVAAFLDVTPEQFSAAVRELLADEPDFEICPEINQKTLTSMDRLYRVQYAGSQNDLMIWW